MVPRGSKVFIDANAIAGACDTGSQGEETLFVLIQVHGPFEQEVEPGDLVLRDGEPSPSLRVRMAHSA